MMLRDLPREYADRNGDAGVMALEERRCAGGLARYPAPAARAHV